MWQWPEEVDARVGVRWAKGKGKGDIWNSVNNKNKVKKKGKLEMILLYHLKEPGNKAVIIIVMYFKEIGWHRNMSWV